MTVTVPARLHLGFLDPSGESGRRFGGIGLAIGDLRTKITIRRAARDLIEGPEHERVCRHLETMRASLGVVGAHHVTVDDVVPAHAGLGSGTQIALAVAAGLRRLHDRPLDVEGDAARLGRGARSGLGIGLFHRGGLVVDGGRGPATISPPVVSHLQFPEAWRILLVLDPARHGMHGTHEAEAFATLPPFPRERAADNCRLVLMQALPALVERDLPSFGAAIAELQTHIGDYFAPIQGGSRFTSPAVAAALAEIDTGEVYGMGQSSWGPTGFAFAPDDETARRLLERLRHNQQLGALDIRICRGLNRGAQVTSTPAVTTEEA